MMQRRAFVKSAVAGAVAASLPAGRLFADSHARSGVLSDIDIVTGDGGTKTVERAVLRELQKALSGRLLLPVSEGYDDARRVWNGMIDKRPAFIVQCRNETDIRNAVNLAREYGALTSIKGGGHNVAGKGMCDGGIAIDCSPMNEAGCDPEARTAYAQPGALLGALDRATQPHGLATPAGVVSHTGVAGLTLGGGFGKLSRVYGLTCDNLQAVDLVTPDGELRRATVSENPDLFWGLRGGGGNFGVATRFQYQCHQVGTEFLSGSLMYPLTSARDVMSAYADMLLELPEPLQVSCNAIILPNGKGFVNISTFYTGDPAEGEKAVAPLRAIAKPMRDGIAVGKYVDIQSDTDRNVPWGDHYYQKAGFMREIRPELVDELVQLTKSPNPFTTTINFTQVGGTINKIAADATAYPNRDAEAQIVLGGTWKQATEAREDYIAAVRSAWEDILPLTQGVYTNNMMADGAEARIQDNFGGNYARLVELKNKYDPTNLLRLNANVEPTV